MNEVPKTPIQVEVGKVFSPFADIDKIEPPLEGDMFAPLVSVPLVFEGIAGKLVLQSGRKLLEDDDSFKIPANHLTVIAPLGEVGYDVRFKDGKIKIAETPLVLTTEFLLSSEEEYNTLSSHRIEVEGGVVYLFLVEEDNFESEAGWYTKRGMQAEIRSVSRYENGRAVDILLPDQLDKLATLRVRFVRRQLDPKN